jgi:hypothetical protein
MPHSGCDKQTMADLPPYPVVRRRKRRYLTLILLVLIVIGGWIGFWKYAQIRAEEAIEGWKAREARAGRVYECGSQTIGGFPFRFELLCDRVKATISSAHPPAVVTASNIHVASQVYQPTLLISEITGPLTYAEEGRPPSYVADWKLAQSSVRGTPRDPQRVSIVLDDLHVKRVEPAEPVVDAERLEVHGRIVEGSAQSNPVIEIVLRSAKLAAPVAGNMAAKPTDSDIDIVLRGLKDFAPKPWPDRFREIAESKGRLEIRSARISQGDTLAVGAGALTIKPNGKLDGQLNVTVAGAEAFINDVLAANKQRLGFSMSIGLGLLGGNKRLEGRPAISLPLRVNDGSVMLGPIKVAELPPVF